MVWQSPIELALVPTSDSESFAAMAEHETGLPLRGHPGSFGHVRKNHTHEGVDLYCPSGTVVRAVEDSIVVAVLDFTGKSAGSDWWHDTKAVLAEGDSGVVLYGEIATDAWVGDYLPMGEQVGTVVQVLKTDKGRPMSMLHLELHRTGTKDAHEWEVDGEKPASLLDPTDYLKSAIPISSTEA